MSNPTAELASQILAYYSTPVGTAPAFNSFATGDSLGAAVASMQTGVGFAQMVGTRLSNPVAVGIPLAALVVDGVHISESYNAGGTVRVSDLYAAAANLSALVGGLAVIGAGGAIVVPVAIGLAIAATATGIALTAASLSAQGQNIDVNDLMNNLKGSVQGAIDIIGNDLSDAINELASASQGANDFLGVLGHDLGKSFIDFGLGLGSAINGAEQSLITSLQQLFHTAEITRSPLILDLDGDGVETISQTAGIHFDLDGNGFAEQTGWVGKDDGLLVWDKNGNGQIDDGSELFGSNTILANGQKAANGFSALAELDSNSDGKVDANDANFSQLRVWKDADSNAQASAGELLSLDQAGVQSLAVAYTQQTQTDAQGNQHLQAGQFTGADGLSHAVDDVWFAVDTARTVDLNPVAESEAIAALPDVAGFGNVHSLHQAMARDSSGHLQSLVQQFAAENAPTARQAILTTLIYAWAGVENIDPASRAATQIYGNVIGDARKLALKWSGSDVISSDSRDCAFDAVNDEMWREVA